MGRTNQLLEQLFQEHSDAIYRYILLMVNDREEAEDLMQEVFIKALKGLHSFKGESSYKTWLYAIARNIIYDRSRKRKALLAVSDLLHSEKPVELPHEILEKKETVQLLYRALLHLKLPYREIIILRKIKGYPIQDTAEILGWSEAKVKTTLHRAIQALKKELLKKGWEVDDTENSIGS
jgi:RNA polymerase sigma-70 factor, ECF subfamily